MSYAPLRRSIILSKEKAFYTVAEGSAGCGSKGIVAIPPLLLSQIDPLSSRATLMYSLLRDNWLMWRCFSYERVEWHFPTIFSPLLQCFHVTKAFKNLLVWKIEMTSPIVYLLLTPTGNLRDPIPSEEWTREPRNHHLQTIASLFASTAAQGQGCFMKLLCLLTARLLPRASLLQRDKEGTPGWLNPLFSSHTLQLVGCLGPNVLRFRDMGISREAFIPTPQNGKFPFPNKTSMHEMISFDPQIRHKWK